MKNPKAGETNNSASMTKKTDRSNTQDPHDPGFHETEEITVGVFEAAPSVPLKHWRSLLIIGGVAPFLTLLLYLSQLFFISWEAYPETVVQWFELFRESRFLALFYLNSLDIISIGILGLMFIALYAVLRETARALMTIATPFAFLGIGVFIVPRTLLLSIAGLSREYFAALNAAGQAAEKAVTEIVAAGRAISSLGVPTIQTAGFFIIALAALLVSLAMLRSPVFFKATGIIGISAAVLTLLDDLSLVLFPAAGIPLLVITGFAWIIWWILAGRRLLLLGLRRGKPIRKNS